MWRQGASSRSSWVRRPRLKISRIPTPKATHHPALLGGPRRLAVTLDQGIVSGTNSLHSDWFALNRSCRCFSSTSPAGSASQDLLHPSATSITVTALGQKQKGDAAVFSNSNGTMESDMLSLARKLISYSTRQDAYENGYTDSQEQLLQDAVQVANHYTKDKNQRPIALSNDSLPKKGELLSRQLAAMMHTLVLPEFDMEFEDIAQLDLVLKGVLYTLRAHARDASSPASQLSMEDAYTAQDLLHKTTSIRISDDTNVEHHKHTLRLCLNNVLNTWAALSDDTKDRRVAAQNAEHLLLSAGQHNEGPTSVLTSWVVPDVHSFNTVMTAWSKCAKLRPRSSKKEQELALAAASRAQAMLHLLVDLSQEEHDDPAVGAQLAPTSTSHGIVLKAWNESRDKEAPERAMELLRDMVERSHTLGHEGPTAYTLSMVYNILARAQLSNVEPYMQQVQQLQTHLGIVPNTILYNSALTAYYRSKPPTPQLHYKVCELMNEIVYQMEINPEAQPDKITYQTVLQAWVDCGRDIYKSNKNKNYTDIVANSAKHAERHLQAAFHANVGIDLHMIHHVMAGFSFDPIQTRRVFDLLRFDRRTSTVPPIMETYGILLEAYEKAVRPGQTWHAQAADELLAEMEERQGNLVPDTGCYNSVIFAWDKTQTKEGAKRAVAVLDRLCQTYTKQKQQLLDNQSLWIKSRPRTTSFMTAITALCRHGDKKNLVEIERLVQQMQDMKRERDEAPANTSRRLAHADPNVVTYSILLNEYSKHARGDKTGILTKAEAIFDNLLAQQDKKAQPDRYSYSAMGRIYGKAGVSASKLKALADSAEQHRVEVDLKFCNIILSALERRVSREGEDALDKVINVLENMEKGVYGEQCLPDQMSYSNVAQAYRRMNTLDSARAAEEMLNRWVAAANASSGRGCTVDIVFYNIVMMAYAESGTPEGRARAVELFQKLEDDQKRDNRTDPPNARTFYAAMIASSPQQAQDFFDLMMSRYRSGDKNVKPDASSFTCLIRAWTESDSPVSAQRAQEAMYLKEAFHTEDKAVFANEKDYYQVIAKWCNKGSPECAEAILETLAKRCTHESGMSQQVGPTYDMYRKLLLCYADRGPSGAAKAQELLDRMVTRAKISNGPLPNNKLFTICMFAWATSQQEGCDAKAEDLLNLALELQEDTRFTGVYPDHTLYYAVVKACAYAPRESLSDPLERGIRLFTLMKESEDPKISPDHAIYALLFRIIGKHMKQEDPRRLPLIKKLFEDCCKVGLLSDMALKEFVRVAPAEYSRDVLGVDEEAKNLNRLRNITLPPEWNRNVASHQSKHRQ